MGRRNFLIEGGSGTGKTAVCDELCSRGYQAIHGDRELAYQGDPITGEPVDASGLAVHHHHIWHVDKVAALLREQNEVVTFFCGGSRNSVKFLDLFDGVFVLDVDTKTLTQRLDKLSANQWGGRGRHAERGLILQLHRTREEIPRKSVSIDATAPLNQVVDEILAKAL